MEDDVYPFIAGHRPGKGDHALLAVDQPVHDVRSRRPWLLSAWFSCLGALPEKKRRDRESTVQGINQKRGLSPLPDVLALELGDNDSASTVILNELTDLYCWMLKMRFYHRTQLRKIILRLPSRVL